MMKKTTASTTSQEVSIGGDVSQSIVIVGDSNQITVHSEIKLKELTWEQMKKVAFENSHEAYLCLADKFRPELYVERCHQLKLADDFIGESKTRYFVISGRSGMGKSGFLFNLAQKFSKDKNIICIVYDCSRTEVSTYETLLEPLAKPLGIDDLYETCKYVSDHRNNQEQKLVLILDAVNENDDLEGIVKRLSALERGNYPWMKIIISCRPHVFKFLKKTVVDTNHFRASAFFTPQSCSGKLYIDLSEFSDSELDEAYRKHQEVFRFEPKSIWGLSPESRRRLREPLVLWLTAEIYGGGKTISEKDVSSDFSVIPQYINKLLRKGGLDSQADIRDAEIILQTIIPSKMIKENMCQNKVNLKDLLSDLNNDQQHIIKNILIKSCILEKVNEEQAHFRYERFYDFYFGHHLKDRVQQGIDLNCEPLDSLSELVL